MDELVTLYKKQAELESVLKSLIIRSVSDRATKNGVEFLINEYSKEIYRLNRISELGLAAGTYSDALWKVGMLRNRWPATITTKTDGVSQIDSKWLLWIGEYLIPNNSESCESLCRYWLKYSYKNKIVRMSDKLLPPFGLIYRWRVDHEALKILSKILKQSEECREYIAKPIKTKCRNILDKIETIIGTGIMVVPSEIYWLKIEDFIRITRPIEYSDLIDDNEKYYKEEILSDLAKVKQKIKELSDAEPISD